ncbi:hypothetical protein K1T71_002064 [Dendrolimus kikuchii]|uniref:Uncharacterized protein n=1 Tax=Dendrolimus kikuchii TaxID=765133 RepID=A0ACC1DFV4_9NEOP|nr:hypothetical protein K1T71_002064 [Dendrolimus kikuchii]
MAEPKEVTTWPRHENIFYQITASALTFEVKGYGNALISLTSTLKRKCEYLVQMNYNSSTYIICNSNVNINRVSQRTPNLISNSEYRRFWISWHGGWIALGRYNENIPIISLATKNKIKYIAFGTCNDTNVVNWRFDLPPLLKQPALKPLSDATVRWVHAGAQLPEDALIGGYENEFLYIIRAPHRGTLTLGKFVPSLGVGFVSWGGSSNEKREFEVLCGYDCSWVPSNSDRIPMDAIKCGLSNDDSEQIYVGRAKYEGHLLPGKVSLGHKVCYMAFGELEVSTTEYEVLVYPDATPFRTKRVFTTSSSELNIPHMVNEDEYDEYEDYVDDYDNGRYYDDDYEVDDFE